MFRINELFGKSPFKPLHEHMIKVKDCVDKLPELKEAFLAGNEEKTKELFEVICKLEHKADIAKQHIRNQLPKSYFLPVDRGDILNFLNAQDEIADAIEDVAVLINMRKTVMPPELKEAFGTLFDRVFETCVRAFEVSGEINDLAETGFGGFEAKMVSDWIEKVATAEWEADKAQMTLSRLLFNQEDKVTPVTIFILDKIIVRLGKIANSAENAADMMRSMLVKR
ncbi:MAG TPA: TIGR00153 family protein [bacterium]|nr:TIGR00153 family protein [bacterium]